jgi:hypothetical protein
MVVTAPVVEVAMEADVAPGSVGSLRVLVAEDEQPIRSSPAASGATTRRDPRRRCTSASP